jgi:cell division protein FtsB
MNDKEMISTMKDRLALQREVIGRLQYSRNQLVENNDDLAKENADLVREIKWLKGE